MGEGGSRGAGWSSEAGRSIVNAHGHLPTDCSALDTVEDAPTTEDREEVRVFTASNLVAAHQHLQNRLNPTFPDGETRFRWFAELRAELIDTASLAVVR